MTARRLLFAIVIACVAAASACILGPKQDDPAGNSIASDDDAGTSDSGTGFKTDSAVTGDAPPPPRDTSPIPGDVGGTDTSSVDAPPGDAPGDAPDGSDAADADDGGAIDAPLLDAPTD